MTSSASIPKKLIIFGVCLPVAVLLGFLMATPEDYTSVLGVGLVLGVLAIPVVLRWHHLLLVLTLNSVFIAGFLPGSPNMWMILAVASFSISLLNRILDKNRVLVNVPSVTWSLLALGLVVWITAYLSGGTGLRSFGGPVYGAKKYFQIWLAIVAYFALSWQVTPIRQVNFLAGGYFLSGLTAMLSNFIFKVGESAWILYLLVASDFAISQAYEDYGADPLSARFGRMGGLAVAGLSALPYLIMRFGARGILDFSKPWRLGLVVAVLLLSLMGGFRSALVTFAILFGVQFINEGLLRTRTFPILAAGMVGLAVLCTPFLGYVERLPISVQRSLSVISFLPVSPVARVDAEGSSEWRLKMWSLLVPEIPKYLWRGKGYTASATDYYLVYEAVRGGFSYDYELSLIAGDYHNGPLSLLIPFGIWGLLAFAAFAATSLRVLYLNFRNGDPAIKNVNTLLFSYFITKLLFFTFVYGATATDLTVFAAVIGMSVSFNAGVRRQPWVKPAPATNPAEDGLAVPAGAAG